MSSATDYYPFGMQMPGRNGSVTGSGSYTPTTTTITPTPPTTVVTDLVVNNRPTNTPAVYEASNSITFEVNFASTTGDIFEAWILEVPEAPLGGNTSRGGVWSSGEGGAYRYGFNGNDNDNDAGEGIQDYGMRIYSERLGRFLSTDPLTKKFAYYTPYQFAGNGPIANIDLDGLEEVHYLFVWVKDKSGHEVVLKLGGQMIGNPTGGVDKDGMMSYKEPYKIYAHYPAQAFGETHLVTAVYNSEADFQNANAKDFYKDAMRVGANRGAEIAMQAGDLLALGYISSSLAFLGKEAIGLFVEQKIAQYSANLINKQALQDLVSVNVRQQILKSGITSEAKLAAIESGTEGAHFLSRHGAQTTTQQQLTRAMTELTPDGIAGKAVASSRFLTTDLQLESFEAAEAAYKPGMTKSVIKMGKTVGNGYSKGGGSLKNSTSVQAYYNSSGEVTTLFPVIPK